MRCSAGLQNTIKRAKLLSQGAVIEAQHLGIKADAPVARQQTEVNAEDIRRALQQSGGVISDAARTLGLSRSAFYRRVKKFAIDLP